MSKLKPFHESIVDAIQETSHWERLNTLGKLITMTKVPKDHDIIIDAWNRKIAELNIGGPWHPVVESLEAQKESVKAEA